MYECPKNLRIALRYLNKYFWNESWSLLRGFAEIVQLTNERNFLIYSFLVLIYLAKKITLTRVGDAIFQIYFGL